MGMSTTIPPQLTTALPPPASPAVYRMTVDEFERIADSLDEEQVELLDGYIVSRDDMKPPRVLAIEELRWLLDRVVPGNWFVREEKPVRIPDYDEPMPDISIVRGNRQTYANHHPEPSDVALLIEVSQSNLDRDQVRKQLIYARAGIPEYWIVNLIDGRIEFCRQPAATGCTSRTDFVAGQDIPVTIDGAIIGSVAVDAILP
jgi:Uma2 family endonuclease